MKKRLPCALLLLLFLTGCTGPGGTVSSPAATPTAGPSAPVPTSSPIPAWWEGKTAASLPAAVEEAGNISTVNGPVCLGLIPEADIGLYGDPDPALGILLRKGEHLQYFPQVYSTARYVLPELSWTDLDGDGEHELVAKFLVDDLDGKIIYELHVYEWDGAGWTDHGFTAAYFRPLLDKLISYSYENHEVRLTAGGPPVTTWYEGPAPSGLAPVGDLVFFREENGGCVVTFGLRLAFSDGSPDRDIAALSAAVRYGERGFSLDHYYLESIGGV